MTEKRHCPFRMPGFEVFSTEMVDGEWHVGIAILRGLVGLGGCGAVVRVVGRRTVTERDLPAVGVPVVIRWRNRIFEIRHALCPNETWTEQHPAIASRAFLMERPVSGGSSRSAGITGLSRPVAAVLGVAWNTIIGQVKLRRSR